MQAQRKSVDVILKTIYGFKDNLTDEQKSIIEVAKILTDKDIVVDQLRKLETLLSQKRESLIANEKYFSQASAQTPPGFKDYKHFSSVMYEWLEENGYSKPVSLGDTVVEEDTVLAFFEKGSLFKDKIARTTSPGHGEWTHLIQWFILTEANKDLHRLSISPVDLLKWIGKADKERNVKIWNITFENPIDPDLEGEADEASKLYTPAFDARSFGKIFRFLISEESENKFPLLHNAIIRRARKYTPHFYENFLDKAYMDNPFHKGKAHFAVKNNASPVHFLKDDLKSQQFIMFLIDECGMDVNLKVKGPSLLQITIKNNQFQMAKILIDKGANTDELSRDEKNKLTESGIIISSKPRVPRI